MAPRLLTLLGLIESSLVTQGVQAVASPPSRSVSFHKGMARMNFVDGSGSIVLQNFTLADGQICVRAVFSWDSSTENGSYSIYPREHFDWLAAADQIASAWVSGRPPPKAMATVTQSEVAPVAGEAGSASEPVAATG